jgi:hypothetical protein
MIYYRCHTVRWTLVSNNYHDKPIDHCAAYENDEYCYLSQYMQTHWNIVYYCTHVSDTYHHVDMTIVHCLTGLNSVNGLLRWRWCFSQWVTRYIWCYLQMKRQIRVFQISRLIYWNRHSTYIGMVPIVVLVMVVNKWQLIISNKQHRE